MYICIYIYIHMYTSKHIHMYIYPTPSTWKARSPEAERQPTQVPSPAHVITSQDSAPFEC